MNDEIQIDTGDKYEATKDLDIVSVAKLLRADFKAAGIKARVRTKRYSMGQSIYVDVLASVDPRSPEGNELADRANAMLQAYNYSRSHALSDYSNKRFYGWAEVVNP